MTAETAWIAERIKQDQIDRYLDGGKDFINDGEIWQKIETAAEPDAATVRAILERSLAIQTLTLRGFAYDVARKAEEAFEKLKTTSYDLILLDLGLPDMDGLEVCKKLKEEPSTVDIPVIMLTAYPDERSLKGAKELGISAFIPKLSVYSDIQFSLKEVLSMVEKNKSKNKEPKK